MSHQHPPSQTKAEKLLAAALSKQKISFRQNVYLGGYEFDFLLPDYRIAIEVDGFFHLSTSQQKLDTLKEALLTQMGYTLFRISNHQLYQNPEHPVYTIKNFIQLLSTFKNSTNINNAWKEPLRKLKFPPEKPKKASFQTPEDYFLSLDED